MKYTLLKPDSRSMTKIIDTDGGKLVIQISAEELDKLFDEMMCRHIQENTMVIQNVHDGNFQKAKTLMDFLDKHKDITSEERRKYHSVIAELLSTPILFATEIDTKSKS